MASDSDRRELHAALEEHLGARPATILMELLPHAGYADLVTRDEFRAGMADLRGEIAALRGDLGGEIGEVRGEIGEVRGEIGEVRGEIAEVRGEIAEVRGEIAEVRGKVEGLLGKFLAASFPLMFGFAGLVLAAVKLA